MKKKLFSLALALALCLGLTVPAFAAELKIVEKPAPVVEGYEDYVNGWDDKKGYYFIGDFVEGLARVSVHDKTTGADGKCGFIDKTGKVVVPFKYDYVYVFCNGFAVVQRDNKLGFVDKTGKEIALSQYTSVWDFSDGRAMVQKGDKIGYIDETGKEIIPIQYTGGRAFSEGLAAVPKNGKWGYIDKTGKTAIDFTYEQAFDFSEGLASVQKDGKMGFINQAGEIVIPCQYEAVANFSEGLATVEKGGKYGFVNKAGQEVIPCEYELAGLFCEGLAVVQQNGKLGFIDKTGKIAIPCQYDDIADFSEGFAGVKKNGKWGFIDTTGKLVVPCKYGQIGPFSGGFAAVKAYSEYRMWGFIDKTGKEVIAPTTYTRDGEEYFFTQGDLAVVPTFQDGYANVCRWFPEGDNEYFYFAVTVDANVSDWARAQVDSAAANGLMPDGLGDDFTAKITRAEFAALAVKLYEAMGGYEDPAVENNPFSDTSDPVVLRANALGIVKGSGGKFRPDDLVSREEAAVMLSRVYTRLGGEIPAVTATTFADDSRVSSWAKSEVAFMADNKIITGKGNNTFDPNGTTGNASIQEAMVIALRMFEKLK